jgi:phosphate:Na+ symporter
VGVVIIVLIFDKYVAMVANIVQSMEGLDPRMLDINEHEDFSTIMTFSIASAHTIFNIVMTIGMVPLVRKWAALLERIIPDKAVKETPHLTSLDIRMVGTPSLGMETCRGEIIKMSQGVHKMMDWTKQLRNEAEPNEQLTEKVFHRERIMDNVQQEVIDFLSNLLTGELSHAVTNECREQLRVADEFESISDYVSNILKANLRMRQHDLNLSEEERHNLDELHDQVAQYIDLVTAGFEHRQAEVLTRAETQGAAITQHVKDMREAHINRLSKSKVDPIFSMSYNQTLNAYRKIKDHALNIAGALVTRG